MPKAEIHYGRQKSPKIRAERRKGDPGRAPKSLDGVSWAVLLLVLLTGCFPERTQGLRRQGHRVVYDLIHDRLAMSVTSAARLHKVERLMDVGPERLRQAWR